MSTITNDEVISTCRQANCCVVSTSFIRRLANQTIGSLAAHRLYRHSPAITIVTDTFRRIQSGCISEKNTPRNHQINTRGEYNSIEALTKKKTWDRETERRCRCRAAASRPCSGPPCAGRSPSCGSTPAKISPKAAGLPPPLCLLWLCSVRVCVCVSLSRLCDRG